ncbi:phosphoserine-tRNA(Cys) ligase [Archaeoglobus sulfaticallidus PM70-1]|uniref:O-phosphoserine--tRNA(Cys) ligase n=1 Tax=Archaeoglobus sulfaticallidus PM70-1 TaxID=387631 RepID=N0BDQ3_9EURY|nr:O-phosphoserine--tRNA ligase [Archaeoglobus sulfaticallidus]AGK61133.1 phosphoserine-tRNA(Cys) ligase [Archaeoglobus sulfaticallidus PM70-1]
MRFDVNEYKKLSEEDFEKAWMKGTEVLTPKNPNLLFPRYSYSIGEEHPLFKTINDLRRAYITLGFKEVVNPVIVEDSHVRRQFGKEALAVLDRCFYLASLPRPNIGISAEKVDEIEKIAQKKLSEEEIDAIRMIFHEFKKGRIDGDDLPYKLASAIEISDVKAVEIIDKVFPEFKALKPEPESLTLRSHMTTGWFITLSKIASRFPLPIKLFSIDRCFRKEQREDATRLYTYFSASCVVVDEDVGVEEGKAVAEGLLRQFGFKKFKFRLDEKRSKYYIPGTQTEVFAFHPKIVGSSTKYSDGWIEIATFGIYSPTALAQYDVEYPVMNLGLGVERLAMILYDYSDVRELVYPWLYGKIELSDMDIAKGIKLLEVPYTLDGLKIAQSIIECADKNKDIRGPAEVTAFEGEIYGKKIRVKIVEREENVRLCGPAYANEVVVYQGSILGVPRTDKWLHVFEHGFTTGIRYIDSFAHYCARKIEEGVAKDVKEMEIRTRVVESLSDINLGLQENIRKYITSKEGKIDIRGPMFVAVRYEMLS